MTLSAKQTNRLSRLHASGLLDREIAERLGVQRRCIAQRRKKLRLAANFGNARHRRAVAQRTARQLKRIGINTMGQLRAVSLRRRVAATGWPDTLAMTTVRVLEALRRFGPMTRREICEAVGLPWHGARKSLKANGPGGSHLAHLMRLGLVVDLGRRARHADGRGGGDTLHVYAASIWSEPAA